MANLNRLNDGERLALEAIIDRTSLYAVATALYEICGDKADHIRDNWQDNKLAAAWDRCGRVFARVSDNRWIR